MNLKEIAGKLKSDVPALALALKDARTHPAAKTLAGITVAYALSPIDLIPDFIPVLGYLDDALLLPLLVVATGKIIPVQVFEQCSKKAEGMWENGKPKRWYYAIPVVCIWAVVMVCVAKILLG